MVSTPEDDTDDSPNVPMTSTPFKKLSARKSLCLFANIFDVKKKTEKRCVGATKSKLRDMKVGNIHSKINYKIKINLYTWITRHPQVV